MKLSALILSIALSADGAAYYVSTDGNDSADGSLATPWLTVQKAANTMTAGDTVVVVAGVYNETVTTGSAGTEGNRVTYLGSNAPLVNAFIVNDTHVTIDGFQIRGSVALTHAVRVDEGGHHLIFKNSTISNSPSRGIGTYWVGTDLATNTWIENNRFINGGVDGAVAFGSRNHVATNNWFTTTNGNDAFIVQGSNLHIVGNTFTNWSRGTNVTDHTDLIQTFNDGSPEVISTNVIWERNYAVNCEGAQVGNLTDVEETGLLHSWYFYNNIYINVPGACGLSLSNVHVYNNTFYRSGTNTSGPFYFRDDRGQADGCRVFNNIYVECGSAASTSQGWYGVYPTITNFFGNYNLVIGTGAGTTKGASFTANGWEGNSVNGQDPLFVNAGANDFRLQSGSPAIGAGTNLSAYFTTDKNGVGRVSTGAWDLGAFTFQAARTLTTTTLNIGGNLTVEGGQP